MGDLDRFELSHIRSLISLLTKTFQLSDFPIFRHQDLGSLMNVIIKYLRSYYYHCVDISAGVPLVPGGITHTVVSVSVLTDFIGYLRFYHYLLVDHYFQRESPTR